MMPRCNRKWCVKTSERVLEVYTKTLTERTSAFPDVRVYLCKKHYDKFCSRFNVGGEE